MPYTADQPTSVPAAVAAVLDAVNRGDTDAFLAAFSVDGTVDDNGRTFRGAHAIRLWSDTEFIGLGGRIDVHSARTTSTGATVDATFTSSGFNGFSRFEFDTAAGEVIALRIRA
jgi:ketosteroid isomerase-like protein